MKLAFYSAKDFDRGAFDDYNARKGHEITYLAAHLNEESVGLAAGHDCVCVFVNDVLNAAVIDGLAALGVKLIAARSAGFNHIDLEAATNFDGDCVEKR